MAINFFIGWTLEDLETELRAAQEDLAAGKSTISAGAGDASQQSKTDMAPADRVKMILRALNKLDPETYPIADITSNDRTRIVYGRSNPLGTLPL